MARKKKSPYRLLTALLLALFVATLLSLGTNFLVFKEIQKRLKIQFSGQYIPTVYAPSFRIEKGSFNWDDKVRLVDGNITVQFDLTTLLSRRGIRIIVKSSGAQIKFLGNWALQEGIEDAKVDTLYADVILGRRGISGINEVEAKSPSFQFSLKNVEKNG